MNNELRDYNLTGVEAEKAIQLGLAEAEWYQTNVSKEEMSALLKRKNGVALFDTFLWFGLIIGSGILVYLWWGSWLAILPYVVYSVLYASTSDSRWHESSHGTAFKSDWLNNALYEISSFMVLRQSTVWRWSHARHHSDTIIRGRDPEISVKRPPRVMNFVKTFLGLSGAIPEFRRMFVHASGKIDEEVATYLPESEYGKVILKARIYLLIYATVIVLSIIYQSILPLMYIGLPTLLGSWLMPVYGLTQHAGLQENVLDHRLNSRTVYMNRIHRFLYWNMNYHVEHHMFPLVPYHALPKLHALIKHDCPVPNKSIVHAYKEIIPAVRKQMKDVNYYFERELPKGAGSMGDKRRITAKKPGRLLDGKIEVCKAEELLAGDVIRFDYQQKTYAIYRTRNNRFYATSGICTHGNAHLADGVLIGDVIECPKHNGRFDVKDGSPTRIPVCEAVKTYKVELWESSLWLNVQDLQDEGSEANSRVYKVMSNENVATFIKELILESKDGKELNYLPGQYVHFSIPPHQISFATMDINSPYRKKWEELNLMDSWAKNDVHTHRNYSMASNPEQENALRFNVRIALSPDIKKIGAGSGSSYVFNLKKGDELKLEGPFGDFLIKDTTREMVYLGAGAGMAPIKAHLSHLFDTQKTNRVVSFWYGARTANDIYYNDYFELLAHENSNFSFHIALSKPETTDNWQGAVGYNHEYLLQTYLTKHEDPTQIEYYLCGPPPMIESCRKILAKLNVPDDQISFDEF